MCQSVRALRVFSILVLALGLAAIAVAEDPRSDDDRLHEFSPGSPFCVTGPVFEEVRGPVDEVEELGWAKKRDSESTRTLSGNYITAVKYVYRDQPPHPKIYPTTNSLDPIVYMTAEFKPKVVEFMPGRCYAFVRVDFNAQISVVPGSGSFAGLGYAIYVKEDGGDGHISHPGKDKCGGDDTCGYLKQTKWGLWLVGSTNELQFNSAATSNFFRARCHRKVEIQAHLFPVNGWKEEPGEVTVNAGFIGLTSGK